MQKVARYTFLLPTYKAHFLKETLDSIQAQSYKNFNVLISDDCSPNPIHETALPFLSDPRFIYRRNEQNIGAEHLVTHWNLLLDLCNTPYVIMAGDDDLYHPDFLITINRLVAQYPEANLFRSGLDKIDANGSVLETEQPFEAFECGLNFAASIFNPAHLHAIGQFVFKTGFLKDSGGFVDFPLAWFSDDATALLASNNGVPTCSIPLFHARNSGLNISSRKDDIHTKHLKYNAIIAFHKWYGSFLINLPDNSSVRRQAIQDCRQYCFYQLMEVIDSLPIKDRLVALRSFPFLYSYYMEKKQTIKECILEWLIRPEKYYIRKYISLLRKEEKYTFEKNHKWLALWFKSRKNRLGSRLGFIIYAGCFAEGLQLEHFGSVIVNPKARIGKNCKIHGNCCIGSDGGYPDNSPIIGDNVDIGQGAQIIGGIRIADNVRIGAGAVVVKDVLEPGVTVVGVPGHVVKKV